MSKFIAGWLKLDPGLMNGGPGVYKWEQGRSTVWVRMNIVLSVCLISMYIDFLSCVFLCVQWVCVPLCVDNFMGFICSK